MISLLRSGFWEEAGSQEKFITGALFLLGCLTAAILFRRRGRLFYAVSLLLLMALCDLMAFLPTPALWSGDGYAITQEIGIIGAFFLVPFSLGAAAAFIISHLIRCMLKRFLS